MAERATIARPYAKAAFEYARAAKRFVEWSEGLHMAANIIADSRVADLAMNPEWSATEVADLVTDVAGAKLDPSMQNLVRVLAENHRLLLLPEIAEQFEALRSEVENTIDVEVISAQPLSDAQQTKLAEALSTRFRRQVRMHASVDANLLGGAVIRAGDLVIDGSLKGRLERLATELTV